MIKRSQLVALAQKGVQDRLRELKKEARELRDLLQNGLYHRKIQTTRRKSVWTQKPENRKRMLANIAKMQKARKAKPRKGRG